MAVAAALAENSKQRMRFDLMGPAFDKILPKFGNANMPMFLIREKVPIRQKLFALFTESQTSYFGMS